MGPLVAAQEVGRARPLRAGAGTKGNFSCEVWRSCSQWRWVCPDVAPPAETMTEAPPEATAVGRPAPVVERPAPAAAPAPVAGPPAAAAARPPAVARAREVA